MSRPAEADEVQASELELERVAKRLKPLGSPTRLRLLRFLTGPHYLEEIASHLKMNRFAAKRHVDELVKIGLIQTIPGRRDSGPVHDYLIAPGVFFEVFDSVRALGELRPAADAYAQSMPGALARTRAVSPRSGPGRARSPFPSLVVVYGAEMGRVHALAPKRGDPTPWVLGRDTAVEIALETDPFASNRHARIARQGPDYVLTDMYSTNGTWLNWDRLPAGESATLRVGDVVGVGKTLFVFRREE